MSRKIFITIPMLCLSLQSTGYASALRELVELGTPLKRVMSMLRPVVPLAREYSSTSRLSAYINPVPQNPLIQRSFTTLPINRLTENMSSVVLYPGVLERRYFSSDSKDKDSIKTPSVSSLEEEIPWLTVKDPWEKIADVTSKYCITTVGTINEKFRNPARWLNELARDFSTFSAREISNLKYDRPFRERVMDTNYLWQIQTIDNPEELTNDSLTPRQKAAINNIKVIKEKASKEIND